jgi:hypothetical protein
MVPHGCPIPLLSCKMSLSIANEPIY